MEPKKKEKKEDEVCLPLPPDGTTDFKEEIGAKRVFRTDLVKLESNRFERV